MRLIGLEVMNFRGYRGTSYVKLDALTAFVGRNDIGKSTLLDALGIFFGNENCNIEKGDRNVHAAPDDEVSITCVFSDLPKPLVLDDSAETNLVDECLVDREGHLRVRKSYSGAGMSEQVSAIALHPTVAPADTLLAKKNSELKQLVIERRLEADLRSNVSMRRALRESISELAPTERAIPLTKEGGKELWTALSRHLPVFALFRSDRASTDEDEEVQDPMKLAVRAALADVSSQLDAIKAQVQRQALDVATRTLEKVAQLDPALASALKPHFRAEPKWDTLFKLTFTGDNDIPVNKRGSGVRRLLLLGFFQAEVERQRSLASGTTVVYAVEEPETSQHPSNQVLVLEALRELSEAPGTQVLLTTHVPGLAGLLPVESLRHVVVAPDGIGRAVLEGEGVLADVVVDLGVLPIAHTPRIQLFVCVEGPTDVEFLKHISSLLNTIDATLPQLSNDERIAVLPVGGSTLADWVNKRYLSGFGRPEVHIYDGDKPENLKAIADVNSRTDGSWGVTTAKREIENYLHPAAIAAVMGTSIAITDNSDVEADLIQALGAKRWQRKRVKRALAEHVAPAMTVQWLSERDGDEEIKGWLVRIGSMLQ